MLVNEATQCRAGTFLLGAPLPVAFFGGGRGTPPPPGGVGSFKIYLLETIGTGEGGLYKGKIMKQWSRTSLLIDAIWGTMNSGDKLSHQLTFTTINGHICEHQANWSGSTTRLML